MKTFDTALDAAIDLVQHDIPVVPLAPETARPIWTPPDGNDKPSEQDIRENSICKLTAAVLEAFGDHPEYGIGLPLGSDVRLIAVSIDPDAGNDTYLSSKGDLPATLSVKTPAGMIGRVYKLGAYTPLRGVTMVAPGVTVCSTNVAIPLPPTTIYDEETDDDKAYVYTDDSVPTIAAIDDAVRSILRDAETSYVQDNPYDLLGVAKAKEDEDATVDEDNIDYLNSTFAPKTLPSNVRKKILNDRGRPIPRAFAIYLAEKYKACFIDGVPAIFRGAYYATGWKPIETTIYELCPLAHKNDINEVRFALDHVMPNVPASPWTYIAFKNGVYDTSTSTFITEDLDKYVIENVIPHNYVENPPKNLVDDVLHDIALGDETTFLNMIEILGVSMTRSAHWGQAPVLIAPGANGKSTLFEMYEIALGEQNVSHTPTTCFGGFMMSDLAGKTLNVDDDMASGYLTGDKLQVFRKAVTGQKIKADIKNKEPIEFRPKATLVMAANKFPRIADVTYGMQRRLFPIPMNAKFVGKNVDKTLVDKLKNEECAERLLWLGLIGLASVMRNGKSFTPNAAGEQVRRDIEIDSDSVLLYLYDNDYDEDQFINKKTADAYNEYQVWCPQNGVKAVSSNKFTRRIKSLFELDNVVKKTPGTGKASRYFVAAKKSDEE